MNIPKITSKKGQEYIFVDKYPSFYLYENMITKARECFFEDELIEIEEQKRLYKSKWEREKADYGL